MRVIRWLKTWQRDERGVVLVEFAIAAPVLVIMVAAVIRIGGFLLERMAIERATSEVAAISAFLPNTDPSADQQTGLNRIFQGVGFVPPDADYRVIVQSFSRSGATYPADWTTPVTLGGLTETTKVTGGGALINTSIQGVMNNPSRWIVVESYRRNFRFSLDYFISPINSIYSRRVIEARG